MKVCSCFGLLFCSALLSMGLTWPIARLTDLRAPKELADVHPVRASFHLHMLQLLLGSLFGLCSSARRL